MRMRRTTTEGLGSPSNDRTFPPPFHSSLHFSSSISSPPTRPLPIFPVPLFLSIRVYLPLQPPSPSARTDLPPPPIPPVVNRSTPQISSSSIFHRPAPPSSTRSTRGSWGFLRATTARLELFGLQTGSLIVSSLFLGCVFTLSSLFPDPSARLMERSADQGALILFLIEKRGGDLRPHPAIPLHPSPPSPPTSRPPGLRMGRCSEVGGGGDRE